MRDWLLAALGGPIGFVVKGVVAAVVGALIGIGYDEAWKYIYHVPWMLLMANAVMHQMNPELLKSLTPTAIGTAAAGAAWAGIQAWFISHLRAGNKAIQRAVNASDVPVTVAVDGIISKDGETVQAVKAIADTVTQQKVEYARQSANPKTH